MTLQHPLPRRDGDVVAGLDIDRGIQLDVRVNDDHVAHLARANVVDATHAGCFDKGAADGLDLLLVHGSVHEVVQRIPTELPAHFGDHESHDQCGDWIQDRVARQVSADPDAHDQR